MTAGHRPRRRRGEPLAALALVLTAWTGARMLLWESPFASPFSSAAAAPAGFAQDVRLPPRIGASRRPTLAALAQGRGEYPLPASANRSPFADPAPASMTQVWSGVALPTGALVNSGVLSPPTVARAAVAPGFVVQPGIAAAPQPGMGRWHVGGWVAWRAGSGLPAVASGARPASYGGTQAGAVAQFDLATGGHRPALHLRATYAPDRPRQGELAAGAGLRPLSLLPVRVMAEVRATRTQGQTEVRPAILAVTELAPIDLLLGLTAEGYAQGGWVGGRYATAFADGQARVTRKVASLGPARVRIGAGAWGGAQKFAERVDVGPTVALDLPAGPIAARLMIDYRVQVAGNATPGDGLALTLSTGF